MMIQHYKVKASAENRELGRAGTPVYEDDEGDLTGFVDFVSDVDMCIYLFEPADLDVDCVVLASRVVPQQWQDRLNEIVMEDDEMHAFWSQVFGEVDE